MRSELEETAQHLVAEGRGILAADESTTTIGKRLAAIGVENTFEMRRAYRELLFTAPGLGNFISGVILYDETIRQPASDGTPFVTLLQHHNIVPGIKVDTGVSRLAGCPGRDRDRRPRRAARAAAGVPRSRRPLRQVAGGDHHRRRHALARLPLRQRARARPLRRAVPGDRSWRRSSSRRC